MRDFPPPIILEGAEKCSKTMRRKMRLNWSTEFLELMRICNLVYFTSLHRNKS